MRRSLFHRIALALVAVGLAAPQFAGPVGATAPTLSQAGPNPQTAPAPASKPKIPPHRFAPLPASDLPAGLDARLKGAKGPVQVMVELADDPAVVVYGQTGGKASGQTATGAARAQLTTIKQKQAALAAQLKNLGATEIYRVQNVYDGIAVKIDASQLGAVRKLANVKMVYALIPKKLDLTSSVPLINAPALWNPDALGLTGTGIKIGIIDSGIDYEHADFGGFGAITPTVYVSNDTTVVGDVPGFPSAKVVGGYDFAGDDYNADLGTDPVPDPDPSSCLTGGDSADHGTHVAGIAAGYGVTTGGLTYTGTYTNGIDESQFLIGPGVAPGAQLYSLRVFGCNGTTNLVTEALDWAADPNGDGDFSDHLDVVNMSLGSDYGSPYDVDSVASDNAALAGVIVVASAGNAGSVYDIVGDPSVSNRAISVASSRDASSILDGFRVDSGVLSGTVQPGAESAAFDWLTNTLPITGVLVVPPDSSNGQNLGCDPFNITNTVAISGNIVLLDWNDPSCGGSVTRTGNAVAAGAIGVLIADNSTVFDLSITGSSVIPALSVSKQEGDLLKANVPLTMTFDHQYAGSVATSDPTIVDTLSSFSSRGARLRDAALKPDITAPGETIFSAHNTTGNGGISFSGTSMAAPHISGSMALLREMHPLWSVEELKALAMNTSLHDLRTDPELPSTVYSPASVGAGRIDLSNTLGTDQAAFNASGLGLVSVSFGSQEVLSTTTAARRIRVENYSTSPIAYSVSYSASVTAPGVSFDVSPATLVVPAQAFGSVVVTMTAVAGSMIRNEDPSVPPSDFGSWLSEASGDVFLDPGTVSPSPLRVPVYVQARPVSDMHAATSSLAFGASDVIPLTGTAVETGAAYDPPPAITSIVMPFESQYQDQLGPIGIPYLDQAVFKNIGITSDFAAEGDVADTEIFVGISTYGNWSTPFYYDTEFDVYFDTNNDGNPDFVLFNASLPDESDTFVTELFNLNTSELIPEDYLDGLPGDVLDMAPYNNSVMVMPVYASDLGLTDGNSRFTYWVGGGPRETSPYYVDESPNMTYDAGQPGLDFTGTYPGVPYWADTPNPPDDSIPVTYPSLAAYEANGSQGVLLLHLHNGSGNRDEVLPVTVPTVQLSTDSQSVLENVGVVSVTATLDSASGITITVPYTVSGSAAAGTDYTGFTSGNFTFAPGITSTTKTLTVVNVAAVDPPKTVIVTLGSPAEALVGSPSVETITLNDVRTVQLSTAAQNVPENIGTVTVTATLNGSSIVTVTVPYTVSGTATAGTDYTGFTSGSFTFAPGATSATKTLTVHDDAINDPSATVIVTLGAPVNGKLGATKVETITIEDNDFFKLYLPLVRR